MNEAAQRAASYLPRWLAKELATTDAESLERRYRRTGAIMFIDLAGFTPFVVSMCESGQQGIDVLQEVLSSFFGALVDEVHRHRGDVFTFHGDALLVGFTAEDAETESDTIRRAIDCAAQARRRVARYESIRLLGRDYSMLLKIGIGSGPFEHAVIGGVKRYTPVLLGDPLQAAVAAESVAVGGQTVIAPDSRALMPEQFKVSETAGFYRIDHEDTADPDPHRPAEAPELAPGSQFLDRCHQFLDPDLVRKAASGHTGFSGEYREVTIMFARFTDIGTETDIVETIDNMNRAHRFVCERLEQFQASLNRVELSDKGYFFLILFGAPAATEARQEKACRMALELSQAHSGERQALQVGIATGYSYCGDIGAPDRRDYTIIGDAINLAARLMAHGDAGDICIDQATRQELPESFVTTSDENVQLKGIHHPQTVFRLKTESENREQAWLRFSERMIGRSEELELLMGDVERLGSGEGGLGGISGEPGIGKSRLLGEILERIGRFDIEPLLGFCQFHRRFTPFSCWQPVIRRLVGITPADDDETALVRIQHSIAGLDGIDPEWSSVIAGLIGVPATEGTLTRNLDPDQVNRRVSQIIFDLLAARAASKPIFLCFEDIHWIDEVSLRLVHYVARRARRNRLLVLVISREQALLDELQDVAAVRQVSLGQLPDDCARELLRDRLPLRRANEKLEEEILLKARGNPFFIESICHSLVEQGLITVNANGVFNFSGDSRDMRIPFTLQDLILTRIDNLGEDEKAVLRIGSVIGRDFSEEALRTLLPDSLGEEALPGVLETLDRLDLTPLAAHSPPSYYFKHIIIRDVAYETLALGTRQALHRRVGDYIEGRYPDHLDEQAELLAHHFVAGDAAFKGLRYSLVAARHARRKFSNQDAIYHFTRSLDMMQSTAPDADSESPALVREELAGVYRQAGRYDEAVEAYRQCLQAGPKTDRQTEIRIGLGHTFQEEGDAARAIEELEVVLRLLGRKAPGNDLGAVGAILRELAKWSATHRSAATKNAMDPRDSARLGRQFDILCLLGKIYFFGNVKKAVWSALAALNVAESLGTPEARSMAYANAAVALMSVGMTGRAAKFSQLARDLAHESDNPLTQGNVYIRIGLLGFYTNQPRNSQSDYEEATDLFRQIGESWEQLTAMGISTTAYAMDSQFDRAQRIFVDVKELASELGSKMHLAWAHCYAPFYRYLIGKVDARAAGEEIENAIPFAVECNDFGAEILARGHLCAIAVRERDADEAARLAKITHATLWRNKGRLPARTPQIALVYTGEAALYALQQNHVDTQRLQQIVIRSARRAIKLGKNFPYILGPAMRLKASYTAYARGEKAAERQFAQAFKVLEQGADRWQAGVGYYEAANWLSGNRAEHLARARSLFERHSLPVELRRLEALEKTIVLETQRPGTG